jgi:hypothetical protein
MPAAISSSIDGSTGLESRCCVAAPDQPKNRLIRLGAYLGPLALAVALKVPLCPTAIISGMPCPGCGMTRAALALAHGDVHRACSLNPLALGVIPTVPRWSRWRSPAT